MKYLNFKLLILFAALALAIPPAWAETVTDVLTLSWTGVTASSYANGDFGPKAAPSSSAYYVGRCIVGNNAIQIKSGDNTGLVSTISGGKLKSISITFNSNTTSGRTVDIYGKNDAYTDASDLYNTSKRGTKLGSVVYGTSTTLTVTGDYEYIGLRSNSGAMFIDQIQITWETEGGDTPTLPSLTVDKNSLTIGEAGGSFTVTGSNLIDNIGVNPNNGFATNVSNIPNNTTSLVTLGAVGYSMTDRARWNMQIMSIRQR